MPITEAEQPLIRVVVGLLENADHHFLVSMRPNPVLSGFSWEFPGGKQESGESVEQALVRELDEEIGIRVLEADLFRRMVYPYFPPVELLFYTVRRYEGEPVAREGQIMQWLSWQQLRLLDMPSANRTLVSALRLPRLMPITPPWGSVSRIEFFKIVDLMLVHYGIVQLRLKANDSQLLHEVVKEVRGKRQGILIVNASIEEAIRSGADGVHLTAQRLETWTHFQKVRCALPPDFLIGASCHTQTDLRYAEQAGVDYVTLSPVCWTASHPKTRPIGWDAFSRMVEKTPLPVYALGGLDPSNLDHAICHGAFGVAGIRSFLATAELA